MSDDRTEELFRKLKKEVDAATAEAQRSKGAFDQLTRQLEVEFECHNLKEAEVLLAKLESQEDKARKEFERQLKEYQKKWKGEE
jgi:hypothetical protein